MAEHTKEPWIACGETHLKNFAIAGYKGHQVIARTSQPNIGGSMEGNARRIVACVNACADIPTDILNACFSDKPTFQLAVNKVLQNESVVNH